MSSWPRCDDEVIEDAEQQDEADECLEHRPGRQPGQDVLPSDLQNVLMNGFDQMFRRSVAEVAEDRVVSRCRC